MAAMTHIFALFLSINFILHGFAFAILGLKRRRAHYFILTGTFAFLTCIYFLQFEGWALVVPGTHLSAAYVLRIGALLCTLSYLRVIYNEPDSWLWKLRRRIQAAFALLKF